MNNDWIRRQQGLLQDVQSIKKGLALKKKQQRAPKIKLMMWIKQRKKNTWSRWCPNKLQEVKGNQAKIISTSAFFLRVVNNFKRRCCTWEKTFLEGPSKWLNSYKYGQLITSACFSFGIDGLPSERHWRNERAGLTSLQGSNEISDHLAYSCHLLLPCPSKPALHHE